MTYHHLSTDDKDEIFNDRVASFNMGIMSEDEFRTELGKLGYNATDIEVLVKFYRPSPPENDDGDAD